MTQWEADSVTGDEIVLVNPAKMPRPETKMLTEQLAEDGNRVSVVFPKKSKSMIETIDGVNYVFYGAWFVPGVRYPIPFPSFFAQLFGLLKRADVAFVTSYIYLPCLVTALFSSVVRVPCVISVDVLVGVRWSYGSSIVNAIAALYTHTIGRCTFALCDLLVVPGEYMRSELKRFVPEDKIAVIPNGIDVEHFSVGEKTAETDGRVDLLFVGRLAPVKNIPLLLRSVELLRDRTETEYALTIVGDGDERERYESLARELEIDDFVRFEGFQPNVRDYYRDADVLVLTSVSEGFPTVLMEAQACGLPVVTTDVGGAREIVAAGNVVPRDDPKAVADAVAAVVDSDTAELRRTARTYVERQYSQGKLYLQYKNIFLEQTRSN